MGLGREAGVAVLRPRLPKCIVYQAHWLTALAPSRVYPSVSVMTALWGLPWRADRKEWLEGWIVGVATGRTKAVLEGGRTCERPVPAL